MDLTPISHLPMRDPRQDSSLAPCTLVSHLRNLIIEAILPHLVLTVPHRLGSRTSLRPRPLHSHRTGRHTYLPVPRDLCLLGPEEVGDRETIVRPPAHPLAVED